jgi:hypothetical protein
LPHQALTESFTLADNKIDDIKRKTRRRFAFAGITLAMYFTFVLNWTEAGASLGLLLGDSHVSGSILLFAGLIVLMICLEVIFLLLNHHGDEK